MTRLNLFLLITSHHDVLEKNIFWKQKNLSEILNWGPSRQARQTKKNKKPLKNHWGYTLAEVRLRLRKQCNNYFTKTFFLQNSLSCPQAYLGAGRCRSLPEIAARWRYRLHSNNLTEHYNSQFLIRFYFGFDKEA